MPIARLDPSVPEKVRVLLAVKVFPSAIVRVAVVAGAVRVSLLTLVAVATPMSGVTRVGEVARTTEPEPVAVLPRRVAVPEASGRVMVRRPPVEAPVILYWFVPGVSEVPAR